MPHQFRGSLYQLACRGSWMPGANEALGCPQVKNFFWQFIFWMPWAVTFFSLNFKHLPLLFTYLLTLFQKTPSLDVPRLDARGRRTPLAPLSARHLDLECAPFSTWDFP